MTLFIWDASDFDWARGPMDLAAAKADGITGFTHKATEGTSIKHTHTGEALNRARAAGMEFIGAYHVVRSVSTSAQVNYFLSYLDQVAPWWRTFPGFFLQVDLELWPYDQVSAATGMAFASALVAAQPKRVITYASRGQYGNSLAGIVTPLWNAAYGNDPAVHYPLAYPGDGSSNWAPYSGWTPVFWQYGSQLRIGTQPGADCSAFRGSLADLRTLIEGEDMAFMDDQNAAELAWRVEAIFADRPATAGGSYVGTPTGENKMHDRLNAIEAKLDQVLAALAALQPPAGGLVPHTHAGGQTGPAQPT